MSRVIKNHAVNIDYEQKINIGIPKIDNENFNNENKAAPAPTDDINMESVARKMAEKIIADARAEAIKLMDDARFEKEVLFQETRKKAIADIEAAKEKTLADAYDEGFLKGQSDAQHLKDEAEEILINAKHTHDETLDNMESQIIELVISICNKLLQNAMSIKPEIIKYLIREGLSKTTLTGEIFIHISPSDYEYAYEHRDEFIKVDSKTKIELINDKTLSKGDILIETPFGNIDSSITNQFTELSEDLLYLLDNR